jgi:hypothetical protein
MPRPSGGYRFSATLSSTIGFSNAMRSSSAAVERNLVEERQHPSRVHSLAARERHDLAARIAGASDGGGHARYKDPLAAGGEAGRDDEIADGSKRRGQDAIDARLLRGPLAQEHASVGIG